MLERLAVAIVGLIIDWLEKRRDKAKTAVEVDRADAVADRIRKRLREYLDKAGADS